MSGQQLSEEKIVSVQEHLVEGRLTQKGIAEATGVSVKSVRRIKVEMDSEDGIIKQTVALETKLSAINGKFLDIRRKYRQAMITIETLTEAAQAKDAFESACKYMVPMGVELKSSPTVHDATPILVCSDWHIDEVIDSASVGGVNEFNLDVARERIQRLSKYAVKLIGMMKKDSKIDTLVIAALGDFMSSWIHDELIETNSITPPEAMLELLNMWTGLIDYILDSGVVNHIRFVGCVGNHTRITAKPQYKNRAKKSYEWMVYNVIMHHYIQKGDKRITFQMPNGYFNWLTLYGQKIRFHHGDNIRYHGGVGGVHIPVRKALAQWNKTRLADLDVFGHWHTPEWSSTYIINGSVIGYSAYAENLKADYNKACQALFLMHQKFGKTAMYPIILQD